MKRILRFAVVLLAWLPVGTTDVLAQTPTLEFAAGAGNPTGNGPTGANQVITLQNNADNPTLSTFTTYTPTTTATFVLSNQQYTLPTTRIPNGAGVAFGGSTTNTSNVAPAFALFPLMNAIGGSTAAAYTSANGVTGGIDVIANRAVEILVTTEPLPTTVTASSRFQFADLTINFNRPVFDPVIHVTGMGSFYGTAGFTAEMDLVTSGLTMTRLSGSTELTVNPTQILNNAASPNVTTGAGAASGSVLINTPASGITTITFRIYLRVPGSTNAIHGSNTFAGDGWMISMSELTPTQVTGYVFEDVNYGGGAGRPRSATGAVVRPNATVELYDNTGEFVATTTTDASGQYTFNAPAGTYTVRVVNSTVTSSRTGYVAGLLPVQTYNGTTTRVGGQNPALADAAANTGTQLLSALAGTGVTPQSIATVTASGATSTGPDFGFNFDVVVNTNNSGQGSLQQFITNANALGGEGSLAQSGSNAAGALPNGVETSIFMIPDGAAHAGLLASGNGGPASQLTSGVASIALTTVLPTITGANTSIDATTQTFNIGNTNNATLGTAGTVGTAGTTLSQLNGPEVQLVGNRGFNGLSTSASATVIRGLSLYGFDNNLNTTATATGYLFERNVLGASATSFTDPGNGVRTVNQGINLNSSDNGTIQNNLIGFNGGMGIWVLGNNSDGANNNTIAGNEIRGNAIETFIGGQGYVFDGIELQGASTNNTVSGNLITANSGHGIDSFGNAIGGNTITGNTISNNGTGISRSRTALGNTTAGEGSGLRMYGATNQTTISNNVLSGNDGSGVLVEATALNMVVSQNSIFDNTRLGIDLLNSTDAAANGATGTTTNVTLNDNGDADTGGNGLTNMPVITSATVRNGNLIVTGYSRPGATLEFFLAKAYTGATGTDNSSFGQGQTYLLTRTEGTGDNDATTGSYSGLINGVNQGTETGQNRFAFTIPLSSLTTAQQTALTAGTALLTATARQVTLTGGNQGTSEFSANAPAYLAPLAVNDNGLTTPGTNLTLTVTSNDQYGIDPATVNLNGQGAGSTTAVSVTGGTFQFLSNGQVQFTPTPGFTGVATVPYTVNNTSGITSNTAYISVEVRTPALDLATSITAPANNASVNAGAALTYTVQATNNTAAAATSVVQTLQLPAGLASVSITGGQNAASATYNSTTGVVSIPVGTLAASSSQTYSVAVSAMPGSGPVTATAAISSNNTDTNTVNNSATNTVNINPRYDVATTISGPATGVVQGNEVTYTVTTSNLSGTAGSASPAPNVVQTVQLPTGLSGVYASNGGTYNSTTGVVTFPTLPALPVGQTVVNSISFVAPAANFAGPTATATANTNNAGDLATANNSANLNGGASNPTVATVAGSGAPVNVYTTISASAATVAPGATVTLTVTANNAGPATATGVQETLLLPTGLTGVTVSGSGTYNSTTGLVTFDPFGALASAGSASATVTFNAPAQGFVLATATVTTTSPDAVPADNLAQTKVEISPVADLATTIAGPTTVSPGQTVTYTVMTSSVGEQAATGVVQRVQLPAGLTGVTVSGGGTYDATTGIVTFNLAGDLAKGTSQTNSISFAVPSGASNFVPVATVSSSTPETVLTNNSASTAVTVQPAADLVTRLTGPTSAPVGTAVTYAVTTTNSGPSTATGVAPTLQLPAGLTGVTVTGGGSYSNATGLVTFTPVTSLPSGASVSNTVTFAMPDVSSINGVARVTSTTAETNLDNNFASIATSGTVGTTTNADLVATIVASAPTVTPGTTVTLTPTFTNAAGAATATTVVPTVVLPAGLTGVTVSGGAGGTYNSTTGLVTWNSVASLAGGAALTGYQVSFTAPSSGNITATAALTSATSEATLTNNAGATTVSVTPSADVVTGVSGPAVVQPGATVSYAVTTLNSGPSPASSTQTVRIPDTATNITFPAGSTQSAPAGGFITITFPAISNQPVGAAGEVTNYVSFTAPNAAYNVSALLTPGSVVGDVVGNNTASVSTTLNRAPVAYNVVNNLQAPEANTAGSLLLSPLVATDADAGSTLTYTITSLPAAAAGVLYLNSTAVTNGQTLTAAQISQLRFDPAAGFIGNAFFTYTATDNATTPLTSNTGLYTIAVGQDVNSTYTNAPNRGGSASNYSNGDLIASPVDLNSARYNSSGVVYNNAVANGTLASGADNGVRSASTDATGANLLASLGLTLNATNGEIRVTDRTLLRGGSYSLNITTVDANGGTNTQLVTFSIGFGPLPVTLVSFEARSQQSDAVLSWKTAQEKNNDHFDVERSSDGVSFTKVGQVAGNGTSTSEHLYGFTDRGAASLGSKLYYRLRQVDTDGTPTLSDVRLVSFGTQQIELAVFPNPAVEQVKISLRGTEGPATVTVYNTAGAVVLKGKLDGTLSTSFDVHALPAGAYLVKVQGSHNLNLSGRFVKK